MVRYAQAAGSSNTLIVDDRSEDGLPDPSPESWNANRLASDAHALTLIVTRFPWAKAERSMSTSNGSRLVMVYAAPEPL